MPTSFLSADAGFPRLTNDIPMEERMNRVQQYLFLLLEQLRYALGNLGEENFNEASLAAIERAITDPIMTVVTDLEGNVSILEQTAASLTSRIGDAEGNISILQQTAAGLISQVSDIQGNVSTLQQTAAGLLTRVSNAEGDISQVSQKANRIDWIVADGSGDASTFTLTSHMASLVADEISISGAVTFNDLETAGQSVINGDNIELRADADGDSVSYLTYKSVTGATFAEIHTRDNNQASTLSQDRYAFVIETPQYVDGGLTALKLVSGDAMSLEAAERIFIKADVQTIINNGTHATRIQANNVYYDPTSVLYPTDCYIFASDGIWYNGNRILST